MTALLRAVLDEDRPKLKRSLGLWMATALVIGNMVGSGVFLLPGGSRGEAGRHRSSTHTSYRLGSFARDRARPGGKEVDPLNQ